MQQILSYESKVTRAFEDSRRCVSLDPVTNFGTKTHLDKRYMCSHPGCLPTATSSPIYFVTWTTLQAHIRTTHPPTCKHESCNGRIFASHHNLRAHLKLHEQREAEALIHDGEESDRELSCVQKRRRGGELGRDWKCDYLNCEKAFKSVNHFESHEYFGTLP